MKKLKAIEKFNIKGRGTLYRISAKESGVVNLGDEVEVDGKIGEVSSIEYIFRLTITDEYCITIREQVCNNNG